MSQQNATPDNAFVEQPFVSHLLELRDRLLRAIMAIGLIFLCLFPFSNDIYTWVASPLMAHLPAGTSMIATEVASPFLTPFKLSLIAAVFLSLPYSLYQLWAFVAPGLYRHEQRLVLPLVVSSTLLFYLGMLFAYYIVFPLIFAFFTATAPEGVTVATDIAKYLDFVLTLFFAFGIAFETPIATILLVATGITTPESLKEKRPYIVVGAFVVGMLLTPPDVFSQTLLAVPMWLLFEAGVFFSRYFVKPEASEEGDEPAPATPSTPPPAPAAPPAPWWIRPRPSWASPATTPSMPRANWTPAATSR
jgi:sec-independent protein translocase protein TatC